VDSLPVWLLLLIFVIASAVIWIAGIQLSNQTIVLAERLHLGEALGGLILLAIATNLPEIAITVSAAVSGNVGVAVGNILGGIAIQTVVLVVVDVFGVRGKRPLTYQAASLSLVVEAAVVILILGVVIAGSQLRAGLVLLRMTPESVLIVVLWVAGLVVTSRAGSRLPWSEHGEAPDSQPQPRGHSMRTREQQQMKAGMSTARSATTFGLAALATLVAGVALEMSGDGVAKHIHLSGVLFGATILALATSLPEISTGIASARQGDYKLAIGDIFGGNAFLPVLFLVAELISGKAVLPRATAVDIYLTAVAILLTLVYLLGILFRPRRDVLRMGSDSLIVLVLYLLSVAGLFAVPQA
jgi:cation:H+ antiporter